MKRARLLLIIMFGAAPAFARPLNTEEAPTIGKHAFEASASISERFDDFGSPKTSYSTVNFPLRAEVGLSSTFDFGVYFTYLSQRLETENSHYTGSMNGQFSPMIKYSPNSIYGFQFIWHVRTPESGTDNLPIVRGDDFEPILLLKLPTAWPVNFNAGYVFRGGYKSKMGISNDIAYHVEPGNIFEAKGALEIPLVWHFSLVNELAYYNSGTTTVQNVKVGDSAAEALDELVGLNWAFGGWNLGAGASFGLLNEKDTSFDLERGAGDVTYKFTMSYRLVPKRPSQ